MPLTKIVRGIRGIAGRPGYLRGAHRSLRRGTIHLAGGASLALSACSGDVASVEMAGEASSIAQAMENDKGRRSAAVAASGERQAVALPAAGGAETIAGVSLDRAAEAFIDATLAVDVPGTPSYARHERVRKIVLNRARRSSSEANALLEPLIASGRRSPAMTAAVRRMLFEHPRAVIEPTAESFKRFLLAYSGIEQLNPTLVKTIDKYFEPHRGDWHFSSSRDRLVHLTMIATAAFTNFMGMSGWPERIPGEPAPTWTQSASNLVHDLQYQAYFPIFQAIAEKLHADLSKGERDEFKWLNADTPYLSTNFRARPDASLIKVLLIFARDTSNRIIPMMSVRDRSFPSDGIDVVGVSYGVFEQGPLQRAYLERLQPNGVWTVLESPGIYFDASEHSAQLLFVSDAKDTSRRFDRVRAFALSPDAQLEDATTSAHGGGENRVLALARQLSREHPETSSSNADITKVFIPVQTREDLRIKTLQFFRMAEADWDDRLHRPIDALYTMILGVLADQLAASEPEVETSTQASKKKKKKKKKKKPATAVAAATGDKISASAPVADGDATVEADDAVGIAGAGAEAADDDDAEEAYDEQPWLRYADKADVPHAAEDAADDARRAQRMRIEALVDAAVATLPAEGRAKERDLIRAKNALLRLVHESDTERASGLKISAKTGGSHTVVQVRVEGEPKRAPVTSVRAHKRDGTVAAKEAQREVRNFAEALFGEAPGDDDL